MWSATAAHREGRQAVAESTTSRLDERARALDWLEDAVSRGLINYRYLNDYGPFFRKLRGEPRFQKLMTRGKEQWEPFEG